jgi:hypothetical protein
MATTTLVVDLQDKYYSKKLDYRYRPPANADSCESPDRSDQPSRARALKNLQDYHPDLILRASNLSLFSSARPTAIPHEFSVYLKHSEMMSP